MRHVLPLFVALAIVGPPLQADAQTDLPLAKIVSVGGEERTITRRFYGQVAARETVDLAFQVGGQIIDFPVVEGDTIERGALVAELDLEPFELAVEQASAQQEQADRNLSRLERLRSSAISEVAISDTRTIADLAAITTRNSVRALEHLHQEPSAEFIASRLRIGNLPDLQFPAGATVSAMVAGKYPSTLN